MPMSETELQPLRKAVCFVTWEGIAGKRKSVFRQKEHNIFIEEHKEFCNGGREYKNGDRQE